MKRILFLMAILVVASVPSLAQSEYPKYEIYGTYQYLNVDFDILENKGAHGWGAGAQWNQSSRLGLVAEFTGAYGDTTASRPIVNPLSRVQPVVVAPVSASYDSHTYL